MGKIIEIDPSKVVPTQDYLIEKNMLDFTKSYVTNAKEALIITKKNYDGNIIVLDGHHRGASIGLLKRLGKKYKLFAWVADSNDDYIENLPKEFYQEGNTIDRMNDNLKRMFDEAEPNYGKTLDDLAKNHSFIESPMRLLKKAMGK